MKVIHLADIIIFIFSSLSLYTS